jgi:hypothetical protein
MARPAALSTRPDTPDFPSDSRSLMASEWPLFTICSILEGRSTWETHHGRSPPRPARHRTPDRLCAIPRAPEPEPLPWDVQQDRRSLSAWIEAQAKVKPSESNRPTSKQVAFAERLARIKRRAVPEECFRDRGLMSQWIDGNR